jgi:UDP-N-acetylmuramoyl-tripeptide--D-alanyl-D-alanine ligase
VLDGLTALGLAARARTKAKVIGITGSVGKTGTKEMLRAAFQLQGKVHAAVRSFNNHWGVPLTLARMPKDTDFAVIEIGMNHPGEIGPLARIAQLDVAVITTVAAVHMEAFNCIDQIAEEKAAIFEGLSEGGVAVINSDIPNLPVVQKVRGAGRTILFGQSEITDIRLVSAQATEHGSAVEAILHGNSILFKVGAPGQHLVMNGLAVLGTMEAVGGDVAKAMLALASWRAPLGRGQRFLVQIAESGDTLELIDESYNANPTSMEAALAVLASVTPQLDGSRVAFLGDMLELGPEELTLHAGLATCESMEQVDKVHTSGPLMVALHNALPDHKRGWHFDQVSEMGASVNRLLDSGDVAMVKGSLGSKVGLVVAAIKSLGKTSEK